ncbi:glycosyltransferase family 2 protein [Candidatus Pelagibacter sp.]|uniref:glycosyltransferase family 2 protein n=1 Tax=Candidatus Pelagibacter sp. TaxID=2024849 RepID=UPI003F86E7B4
MFTKKSVLIIPTKDRFFKLKKTINQFAKLKISFKKIIVIDSSSDKFLKKNVNFYKKKKIHYVLSKPSISKQRNIGLKLALKIKSINYIFFLDDDIIFEKNAFKEMDKIIKKNKMKDVVGFGFNPKNNLKKNFFDLIKESILSKKLGLYDQQPGIVLQSGWQTKIQNLKKNLKTNWASSAALVLKKQNIKNKKFDESFGNYSYLEDIDFSLQFKPLFFFIVSKAYFFHLQDIQRTSFRFGFIEVVNRYKIVKKYKLKKFSYFKMIILKSILNLLNIFFGKFRFINRFVGNIYGIIYVIFFGFFVK